MEPAMLTPEQEKRYGRQILLPVIGPAGQERLGRSRVAVVGCGGLGSVLSQIMVRMGVGRVTVIDGDRPDVTNLHRQIFYDEADVAAGLPKAQAAAEKLCRINSKAEVVGIAEQLDATNADRLLAGHAVILDGTDNLRTRYLLNAWSIANHIPWVYGAVMFAQGMMLVIRPGKGPCLACLFPEPLAEKAAAAALPIFPPAPVAVACLQATEAVKLLLQKPDVNPDLVVLDLWGGGFQRIPILRNPECTCCGRRGFAP
jgi:adenylyltransferase/sulfurtransferase